MFLYKFNPLKKAFFMPKLTALKNFIKINNSREALERFPLSALCIFILTALNLNLIFKFIEPGYDINKLIILFTNGFFAFTSLKLYAETHQWKNNKYLLFSAFSFAIIAYITLNGSWEQMPFLTGGLILSTMTAPFFRKNIDETICCNFNCLLLSNIFFALLSSLILICGISAILGSVGYLFEIKIDGNAYLSVFAICAVLFPPLYVLSGMPKDLNFSTKPQYPKGIEFIVTFILLPLILLYLLILYSYIIKIIFDAQLPKGRLTYMISSFGIAGIITHFLAFPLIEKKGDLPRLFCRYFYHFLFIPLLLLFMAIIIRINEYGITEQRYLTLLIAIWLGISSIYAILTKATKLKLIPITLSILLILASFGPWGASAVSQRSQVARLEILLKKENILQNGKIVKATHKISPEYQKNISGIINYLAKTKKIDQIKNWFPRHSYINNLDINNKYINSDRIMEDMGLIYIDRWVDIKRWEKNSPKTEIKFSMKNPPQFFYDGLWDISGFDYLANFNLYNTPKFSSIIKSPNGGAPFSIFISNDKLIIFGKDSAIEFDLAKLVENLKISSQEKDFILEQKNAKLHIKLYITDIRIADPENSGKENYLAKGIILIKTLDNTD
jgi:hypothetical protein